MGPWCRKIYLDCYIFIIVTLIITAVSNGANLTDGLDGLAAGVSAIIGAGLVNICICKWQLCFCRLSKHNVHTQPWRIVHFCWSICWCLHWLPYGIMLTQHRFLWVILVVLALGGIIASLAIIVR